MTAVACWRVRYLRTGLIISCRRSSSSQWRGECRVCPFVSRTRACPCGELNPSRSLTVTNCESANSMKFGQQCFLPDRIPSSNQCLQYSLETRVKLQIVRRNIRYINNITPLVDCRAQQTWSEPYFRSRITTLSCA